MLAVWQLKEKAYAIPIMKHIKEKTGKSWAFGALFVMLSRLERKGLLESCLADPTPQRGGRSKRIYRLSQQGQQALAEAKKAHNAVWAGVKDFPLSE
jgi:DNA-binding PadR family transcriptional regulator